MAKVNASRRAGRLASERMDAAMEADLTGTPLYPDGTAFVGSDHSDIGEVVLRRARERTPLLIVYPDGEERLLVTAPRRDSRWAARALGRLRRASWRVLRLSARARRACRRTAAP
jgi:hypothetical protein